MHDYAGVDFDITFDIINKEIPKLKGSLQLLVKNELKAGILSMEELYVARNSTWYKHIDFSALV